MRELLNRHAGFARDGASRHRGGRGLHVEFVAGQRLAGALASLFAVGRGVCFGGRSRLRAGFLDVARRQFQSVAGPDAVHLEHDGAEQVFAGFTRRLGLAHFFGQFLKPAYGFVIRVARQLVLGLGAHSAQLLQHNLHIARKYVHFAGPIPSDISLVWIAAAKAAIQPFMVSTTPTP